MFELINLCPRKRKAPADPSAQWVGQELDLRFAPARLALSREERSARNTLRAGLLT